MATDSNLLKNELMKFNNFVPVVFVSGEWLEKGDNKYAIEREE